MPGVLKRTDVSFNPLLAKLGGIFKVQGLVGRLVFPTVPVTKPSGNYPVWKSSHWLRLRQTLSTYGEEAKRAIFALDLTGSFVCKYRRWAVELPRALKAIAETELNLAQRAVEFAKTILELQREYRVATACTTSGNWSTNMDISGDRTPWDDIVNSDPLIDLLDLGEGVRRKTAGYWPNLWIIPWPHWLKLRVHPKVLNTLFSGGDTGGKLLRSSQIESWVQGTVLIPGAMYTTDNEATAEASVTYTDMWGNYVFAAYVSPASSLMTPSAGYTLIFREGARDWYEVSPDQDVVEWFDESVEIVTSAACGALASNVLGEWPPAI